MTKLIVGPAHTCAVYEVVPDPLILCVAESLQRRGDGTGARPAKAN